MQTSTITRSTACLARASPSATLSKASAKLAFTPRKPLNRASLRVTAFKDDLDDLKQSKPPYKIPTSEASLVPAFTRRRERTVGRIAMLGVAAAWAGEVLTGMGPISQLSSEVGVPMSIAYGATFSLAVWQLILGLNQFNPTWSRANQADVNRRTKGITGVTPIEPDVTEKISPIQEPGKFFLRGELVLGRSAMLSKSTSNRYESLLTTNILLITRIFSFPSLFSSFLLQFLPVLLSSSTSGTDSPLWPTLA